jgi:hypothetical protein
MLSAAKLGVLQQTRIRNKRNTFFFIFAPELNQFESYFVKKGGENRDSPPKKNKQKAL